MKFKKNTLFFFLILALGLNACSSKEKAVSVSTAPVTINEVIAEGKILPKQDLRLNFSVRGTVTEILVQEGEKVNQGQILIRLADQEDAKAALRAAEMELISAQQAYDDFVRTGGLATANAWQAYQDAQIRRAEAEREWEKLDHRITCKKILTMPRAKCETKQKICKMPKKNLINTKTSMTIL